MNIKKINRRITGVLLFIIVCGLTANNNKSCAQTAVFVESFGNTLPGVCDQGTIADGYPTVNGVWTVTTIGTNDSAANIWYISATEPGLPITSCATPGCHINASYTNRTLHIGNVINSPNAAVLCPTGDCGAVYDPGGFQTAVLTNARAESPSFVLQANSTNFLTFNYIEHGDTPGDTDYVLVVYFDGTQWLPAIANPPRTAVCGGNSVQWERYQVLLPAIATTSNVKIGFQWMNNNGGIGSGPSFAVDSIVVYSSVTPVANITVSDTDICVNDCINFFADSSGALATYNWLFNGSSTGTSTLQNPTGICYPGPGTYTARLIVNIPPFSADTDNVTIVVNPCVPPTIIYVAASDTDYCERSCITFSDSIIDGATGWNWSFPGGVPATSSLPTPPPICYNTPGVYDVTLIAFNQFGADTLVKTAYLNVNVCPLPIADFFSTPTQFCPQHCVTFSDLSLFGPILAYDWFFPGGTPDTSTAASPNICYTQEGLFDVQLIVTNQYGSDTTYHYSEVNVQFVAGAFASPDTEMFFGSSYQMNAGGGVSYLWSPAAGLDSTTIPNPVATPTQSTIYTVEITDAAGCISYRQVKIIILHNNTVFVPNSFSPNGDGNNDYLFVRGNNLYGVRFTVFDRWGEKVFETTNQSMGWDGTYKGNLLEPGVYTYVVTVNYNNKGTVTESGTVTLVR